MENQIIVESYMRRLGVPYTPSYLKKRMEVIPFAESMLGLAAILSEYNIPNRCVRVSDDDVLCLDQPFITMRNGGFIIAELMKNGEVIVPVSAMLFPFWNLQKDGIGLYLLAMYLKNLMNQSFQSIAMKKKSPT